MTFNVFEKTDSNGKSMAMTKDIKVFDQIYLQYATSSGCDHPSACNRKTTFIDSVFAALQYNLSLYVTTIHECD